MRLGLVIRCAAGLSSQIRPIEEVIAEAEFAASVGFSSVWARERHFTSNDGSPAPLLLLASIAARVQTLSLGTAVLTTPWHNPMKLLGELAYLSNLTKQSLLIGIGRGSAPSEFSGFGIDMAEAERLFDRFARQLINVGDSLPVIWPTPRRASINFYGAISKPESASRNAALGLHPLFFAGMSWKTLDDLLKRWDASAPDGTASRAAIMVPAVVGSGISSDAGCDALRQLVNLENAHQQLREHDWTQVKGYEYVSKISENFPQELTRQALSKRYFVEEALTLEAMQNYESIGVHHLLIQVPPSLSQEERQSVISTIANLARRL